MLVLDKQLEVLWMRTDCTVKLQRVASSSAALCFSWLYLSLACRTLFTHPTEEQALGASLCALAVSNVHTSRLAVSSSFSHPSGHTIQL